MHGGRRPGARGRWARADESVPDSGPQLARRCGQIEPSEVFGEAVDLALEVARLGVLGENRFTGSSITTVDADEFEPPADYVEQSIAPRIGVQ